MIKTDLSKTYDNLEYKVKQQERRKEAEFLKQNFIKLNPVPEEIKTISEETIDEII